MPLDPTGPVLHEAILPRHRVKAALSNTYKQHVEAAQTRRQRNMAQMKEWINTLEKDINKIEISNLTDAEFKILVIRMLKELNEDLSSLKKIQSEMKDSLSEIRNNLGK